MKGGVAQQRLQVIGNHLHGTAGREVSGKSASFNLSVAPTIRYGKYEHLLTREYEDGAVILVEIHRPKAMNALCLALINEMHTLFQRLDDHEKVKVIVLTGNKKAFAAGADIREMKDKTLLEMRDDSNLVTRLTQLKTKKPLLGVVCGYALGGGLELALLCDIIIAGDNAKFGLPEIKIGTIPGAGGTQRLPKVVGKSNAMEMILTGDYISGQEAFRRGLVSHVVSRDQAVDVGLVMAGKIAKHSIAVTQLAKQSILRSFDLGLEDGIEQEKSLFHTTFALDDRKEGMLAFMDKRSPNWTHQ